MVNISSVRMFRNLSSYIIPLKTMITESYLIPTHDSGPTNYYLPTHPGESQVRVLRNI